VGQALRRTARANLEAPEVLYLALAVARHGKGVDGGNHVEASLEIAGGAMDRLDVGNRRSAGSTFSARRNRGVVALCADDIFNPETVADFSEKMGTPERLKMLTLLTMPSIKAVESRRSSLEGRKNVWKSTWERELLAPERPARACDVNDEKLARLFRSLAPVTSSKIKNPRRIPATISG